jgi:hypothetical protein
MIKIFKFRRIFRWRMAEVIWDRKFGWGWMIELIKIRDFMCF